MISIVVPCFNEAAVLPLLFDRIVDAAAALGDSWEVILVDDGSKDKTWQLIAERCDSDSRFRGIRFARNFGHQTAVSAGMAAAGGDYVAVLDADLQDPPELLRPMLDKMQEGYDVVYGVRRNRKEGLCLRAAYFLFYRILSWSSQISIPLDAGDFCLMSRRVVDAIGSMPERERFIRGLRAWTGFRQAGMEYERSSRAAGESKYNIRKLLRLGMDGIFSFSTTPLRLSSYLGIATAGFAAMAALFTLVQRLFSVQFAQIGLGPVPGYATTVIGVFFMGGVQLVCLGILGEYLGRIYAEVKARPYWVIAETTDPTPPTPKTNSCPASYLSGNESTNEADRSADA